MKKKQPLCLCLNDWHVGSDSITESIINWDEAVDHCVKNKIKKIYLGGDAFKSRVAQNLLVLTTVKDCIKKAVSLGIEVVFAAGNHDLVDLEAINSYCHVFEGLNGYTVVGEHLCEEYDDVAIHIMAYFPESGSFKKRLKEVKLIDGKKNILYVHEGINGALGHSDETNNKELPTHIFDRFDLTIVGHYHNRVTLKDTNIHYVGSSRQHNFGEDEEKGYTVIYSDGSIEFIKNEANVRYVTYDVEYEDIDKSLFQQITEAKERNFKVRVVISCLPKQKKLINKKDFTEAGASKVIMDVVSSEAIETKQSSGCIRFDKAGLKISYKDFCEDKGNDPSLGLECIDLINI